MPTSVYLPRTTLAVGKLYASALKRSSPFTDNPSKGQEHFFRGVRHTEKKNFLNGRYSIGPHDDNPVLCGFHHAEVFGWWFDPDVHEREIPDDDVFWSAAVDLTPDHLDVKSKIKLIREFSLSPSRSWRDYFGNDWHRAYQMAQTDPIVTSLLDAEDILIGLRFAVRKKTAKIDGRESGFGSGYEIYVDINTSHFIGLFDYLDKHSILEDIVNIRDMIDEKSILDRIAVLEKSLVGTSFKGNRSDLISEILMSAFLPVPRSPEQARINSGNFSSALKMLRKIDPGSLRGDLMDDSSRDPLFYIFANRCRRYSEVEPEVFRFDF